MSTRCHIQVKDEDGKLYPCQIYRHSDGYPQGPSGVPAFLKPFVKKFIKARGVDPEYFIAQCLRHEAFHQQAIVDKEIAKEGNKAFGTRYPDFQPRNSFLGYGVCTVDDSHGDISFTYTVDLRDGTIEVKESGVEKTRIIRCIPQPKKTVTVSKLSQQAAKNLIDNASRV